MTERRDKKIALAASVLFHGLVFASLAACGVFSFLQHHQMPQVTDVTLYSDDAMETTAAGAPAAGSGAGGMTVEVPAASLPEISETYTEEVEKEREIRKEAAEKGLNEAETEELVKASAGSAGIGSGSSGESGGGPGNGSGTGGGTGQGAGGTGAATARRPAQKAQLISSPSFVVPESARKGLHGSVVLEISISADGTVTGASVISNSTGSAEVEAAAVQFAYALQYEPAVNENGDNVATSKTIPINF